VLKTFIIGIKLNLIKYVRMFMTFSFINLQNTGDIYKTGNTCDGWSSNLNGDN